MVQCCFVWRGMRLVGLPCDASVCSAEQNSLAKTLLIPERLAQRDGAWLAGRCGLVGLGLVEQYSHGDEALLRAVCAVWLKAGGGMIAQETHQAGPDAGNRKQRSHGESFRS